MEAITSSSPIIYIGIISFTLILVYIFSMFMGQGKTFEDVIAEQKKSKDIFLFTSNSSTDKSKKEKDKKSKKVFMKNRTKAKPSKDENGSLKEPQITLPSKVPESEPSQSSELDTDPPKNKKRKTLTPSAKGGSKNKPDEPVHAPAVIPKENGPKVAPSQCSGEVYKKEAAELKNPKKEAAETSSLKKETKESDLANGISEKITHQPLAVENIPKPHQKVTPEPSEEKKPALPIKEEHLGTKDTHIHSKGKNDFIAAPKEKKEVDQLKEKEVSPKEKKDFVIVPKEKRSAAPILKEGQASLPSGQDKQSLPPSHTQEDSLSPPKQEKQKPQTKEPLKSEADILSEGVKDVLSPAKKSKKSARHQTQHEQSGMSLMDGVVSASKLVSLISTALLSEEEVQVLIDLLLNIKGEAATWTKKNDPVATLRRQLAEKEAQLEAESAKGASATQKLRELRQEFNTEKTRWGGQERVFKDQLAQLQGQIRTQQAAAARQSEDLAALNSKLQAQALLVEEQNASKKALQEEIAALKKTIADMEQENERRIEAEVSRLTEELKQWEERYSEACKLTDKLSAQLAEAATRSADLLASHDRKDAQLAELHAQLQALDEKNKIIAQHEITIKEKDMFIQSLREEVEGQKGQIATLKSCLEEERHKRKEIETQKNESLEALHLAEERLKELATEHSLVQDAQSRLIKAEDSCARLEKLLDDKHQHFKTFLATVFPSSGLERIDIENIQEVTEHCTSFVHSQHAEIERLKQSKAMLESQGDHYKKTLIDAESLLKRLQSNVEAEEAKWSYTLSQKDQELSQVIQDKKQLQQELERLGGELAQLKAKPPIPPEVESRLQEADLLQREKTKLEKELEQTKLQLEKELKVTKDLSAHTLKLTNLVKAGEEALHTEQNMVKELQAKLLASKATTDSTQIATSNGQQDGC